MKNKSLLMVKDELKVMQILVTAITTTTITITTLAVSEILSTGAKKTNLTFINYYDIHIKARNGKNLE